MGKYPTGTFGENMWFLLEICLAFSLVTFSFTQVIIPIWRGTHLFPWFRKIGQLEKEIVDVRETLYEKSLTDKIKSLKNSRKGK